MGERWEEVGNQEFGRETYRFLAGSVATHSIKLGKYFIIIQIFSRRARATAVFARWSLLAPGSKVALCLLGPTS